MKGSLVLAADLMRQKTGSVQLDTVATFFLRKKDRVERNVQLRKDLEPRCRRENVVIIEDIIDTGQTLKFLCQHMALQSAGTVEEFVHSSTSRPVRLVHLMPIMSGLRFPDEFVIGYGIGLR